MSITHCFFVSSQAIKDLHLLVIVAGLLAVDVVFLSCWIAIDPLQAEILTFEDMVRNTHSSLATLKISVRSPFQLKNVPNKRNSIKTNSLFSIHTFHASRIFQESSKCYKHFTSKT